MLRRPLGDHVEDRRDLRLAHQVNERGLRVAPGQIPEQLVDGRVVRFEAVPDFTLGYEDIRALVADENIRAAAFVEGLPGAG